MKIQLPTANFSYQFRNWDIPSNSPPILLLHSALSTHKEFERLSSFYENRRQILIDFPAHGESTTSQDAIDSKFLATLVRDLLIELKIFSVDIIGYSMGGYVALELALIAPSLVRSIVSHAMKFYWNDESIAEALEGLDVEKIKARSQKGYEILSAMHGVNGLDKTVGAMRSIIEHFRSEQLSEEMLKEISSPLMLSVGDSDNLVSLQEITKLYESQDKKNTYLAIHPHSPHQFSKLDLSSFTHSVREFWKTLDS